jgi:hypothetical protein
MKKFYFLIIALLFVLSCGGGGGGGGSDSSVSSSNSGYTYITWSRSVNGTVVMDATNDNLRFEASTGYMIFGSTRYTNAYVNDSANFILNGKIVGGVYYVKSTNGNTITGLLDSYGYFLDIYGFESDLTIKSSTVKPVLAKTISKIAPMEEPTSSGSYNESTFAPAEGPIDALNAFSDSQGSVMNDNVLHYKE